MKVVPYMIQLVLLLSESTVLVQSVPNTLIPVVSPLS